MPATENRIEVELSQACSHLMARFVRVGGDPAAALSACVYDGRRFEVADVHRLNGGSSLIAFPRCFEPSSRCTLRVRSYDVPTILRGAPASESYRAALQALQDRAR